HYCYLFATFEAAFPAEICSLSNSFRSRAAVQENPGNFLLLFCDLLEGLFLWRVAQICLDLGLKSSCAADIFPTSGQASAMCGRLNSDFTLDSRHNRQHGIEASIRAIRRSSNAFPS